VRRATGRVRLWGGPSFSGYEIHMGETQYENGAEPFAEILRECEQQPILDGADLVVGTVWGTYIHGYSTMIPSATSFLYFARETSGLTPARAISASRRNARRAWTVGPATCGNRSI